jgi:SSS family solute:Na+ symporter
MYNRLYLIIFGLSFLIITALSLLRFRQMKTSEDFSVASRSLGPWDVSWVIIGTLVGGASTIGTVQMAYESGFSAWIFTLGSGIACFFLGLLFSKALRERGKVTVSEFLGIEFGKTFQVYSSTFTSIGMFVHVVGQFLASMAILQSIFDFSVLAAIITTFFLMALFVTLGGVKGAGLIGKFKFFILYGMLLVSAIFALKLGNGLTGIFSRLPDDNTIFYLFSYGTGKGMVDLGAMIVGVISTQIYLQAIFSARDVRAARNGAYLSAAIIPPVGIMGIVIGLYLRGHHPELAGNSAQALPFFLNTYFPPAIAAFFSAGLLLVVLGTGSGLILGVTTNLDIDFFGQFSKTIDSRNHLFRLRILSLIVLSLSLVLVVMGLESTILQWSYLSMGLRGSAIFFGLCLSVFLKSWDHLSSLRLLLYLLPPGYIILSLMML